MTTNKYIEKHIERDKTLVDTWVEVDVDNIYTILNPVLSRACLYVFGNGNYCKIL